MVCDANYRITNVVAKWPGSVHDARIYRNSVLKAHMDNGDLFHIHNNIEVIIL